MADRARYAANSDGRTERRAAESSEQREIASFPGARLSLLPRNNSTYDLWAGQRSYVELLRGRRESLGTRLAS